MKARLLFVSHAAEDRDLASHVLQFLEARGLKCWMAPRNIRPSADWAESIIDAIDAASGMVLLVSRHSNESPQVRRELERAVSRGLAIYPLFMESMDLSKWMQYYISPHQWHDATDVSLGRKLEELLDALRNTESGDGDVSDLDCLSALLADDLENLAETLDSSGVESERLLPGERKKIAVLHLTASLADREVPFQVRASVSRTVANLLERSARLHGGHLEQVPFTGYRCLFGLDRVHEDDESRALSCGISLLEGLERINAVLGRRSVRLDFGLGIASGIVRVVGTGGDEISVHGEALLSAQELAGAGSGGFLATEEFQQSNRNRCFWKKQRDGVFRVLDGVAVPPGSGVVSVKSPFVGRDGEMSRLESLLERQASGIGISPLGGSKHLLMRITGEAGIGKSRLVHQFIGKHCAEADFHVLRGQTLSFAQPPCWLWTSLLRNLLGMEAGGDSDYGRFLSGLMKLRVSDEVVDSAPFLASLLALDSGDPRLKALDERAVALETRIGFGRLLKALSAAAKILVVLEDVHFLDEVDRSILEFVLENCVTENPIVFLLVSRPENEDGKPAEITVNPLYAFSETLELGEVEESASLDLAGLLLRCLDDSGVSGISPEAFRFIQDRSHGNPFFLEELVSNLVERGDLAVREGLWSLEDRRGEPKVPGSLTGLIQSRLERLPESWRSVLQNSSVLGMEFQLNLYWKLVDRLFLGRCHIDVFDGLEARSLLLSRMSDFDRTYFFSHILVHDTAYSSILESNLRKLHKAAAEALQEMFPGELTRIPGILMHHYERAGEPDKAMEWGFKALEYYGGEEALKLSFRLEEMLARLRDGETDDERLFKILSQRERALDLLGRREQQKLVVDRMMEIAFRSGNDLRNAVSLKKKGALARVTGRLDEARSCLEKALELSRRAVDRAFEGIVLGNLGALDLNQGRFDQAREFFEKALRIHREAGDLRSEGIILMNLGIAHKNLGRADEARACYESALETARRAGDRRTVGDVLGNIGTLLWAAGSLEEAANYYGRALDGHREMGNRRSEGITQANLAVLHMNQGRRDEALERFEKALDMVREKGDLFIEGSILSNLGVLHADMGHAEDARDCYERALEIHRTTGNRPYEALALGNLGNVHMKQGSLERARSLYLEALEVLRAVRNRAEEGNVLANLGRLNVEEGRMEEASECHLKAYHIIQDLNLDSGRVPGFADLHESLLAAGMSPGWPSHWEPR